MNHITDEKIRGNKIYKSLIQLGLILFVVFIVFEGTAKGVSKPESRVVFDKTKPFPLELSQKSVELSPGISKDLLDRLNIERDPEAIKALMVELGQVYNIDWRLVYAIGYHESANYNSALAVNNNNFFGRKASGGGYASWASPEEGIRNQFEYLKTRYFDRGLDSPREINSIYAEDPSWCLKIEGLISSL